jgi:hypothetical protein
MLLLTRNHHVEESCKRARYLWEKLHKNKVPPAARLLKGSMAATVMSSAAFLSFMRIV